MRYAKLAAILVVALTLTAAIAPGAVAEPDQGNSITITIDRKTKPQSFFHPGRFFMRSERREATLTVYDHVIRDYNNKPIEALTIQTTSGRTKIPIESVKAMRLNDWVERRTDDIPHVECTVNANILFVDGTQKQVLMNADFGTIEGKTDKGDFFLKDPHTVRYIEFHR